MPNNPTHPGIYVAEIATPSAVTGVASGVAAFLGPVTPEADLTPARLTHRNDVARYASADPAAPLAQALRAFFENGGHHALVVPVATTASDQSALIAALDSLAPSETFNLLVIPPLPDGSDIEPEIWAAAARICRRRRALLLIDAPLAWEQADDPVGAAIAGIATLRAALDPATYPHAALYFPRLVVEEDTTIAPGGAVSIAPGGAAAIAPSGAIAGVIARKDAERGLWKAPAGLDASFGGVSDVSRRFTDRENGRLNPHAINTLRRFPIGPVVWGARTLAGADALASEWKYIPVCRLAWFIEESLRTGLAWAIFEANDAQLWTRIRARAETFLTSLFRQGAFQGIKPEEAYFVTCDATTTTPEDIASGRLTLQIGFAPLKPAEFIIVTVPLTAQKPA
ncbi:phage tail sheath family protein [Dongia sp.]|uniref:phage tail sheath family protein n=1 Tax=Dongia sp. TaxID=1977262 RepID=UPI0035AF7B02